LVVAAVWVVGLAARAQRWTVAQQRTVSVALLQGAIAQDLKWKPEQLTSTLDLYARLTVQNLGTELIVWPDAAVPTLIEYVGRYVDDVRRVSAARGSTVLLGILRGVPEDPGEAVGHGKVDAADNTGAGETPASSGGSGSRAGDSGGQPGAGHDAEA